MHYHSVPLPWQSCTLYQKWSNIFFYKYKQGEICCIHDIVIHASKAICLLHFLFLFLLPQKDCFYLNIQIYVTNFLVHLCSEIHLEFFEGCGFVQFSHRDMALAAIKGLNGIFTMSVKFIYCFVCNSVFIVFLKDIMLSLSFFFIQGSDQPLIVRIADPKKPRIGEQRFYCFDFFFLYQYL